MIIKAYGKKHGLKPQIEMRPKWMQELSVRLGALVPSLDDAKFKTIGAVPLVNPLAVAEQYPDLKLSAKFQSLITALVEVEKNLANERLKFNEAAMVYWSNVCRFPSNFFAAMFSYKPTPYFTATQEAQTLKPIAY